MAACGAEKKPVQEESIVPLLKDPITATKNSLSHHSQEPDRPLSGFTRIKRRAKRR